MRNKSFAEIMSIGMSFNDIQKTLHRLEWYIDLRYDCLMQVLSEELGEKEAQSLHKKAIDRFAVISETPTQPENAEKEREKPVQPQDDWRDNET